MKPSVGVSVIIPVYNCEPYIEATLISLLRQTDKNFEIILIDDCSTDQSVRIIHRFIDSNPGPDLHQKDCDYQVGTATII